MSSKLSLWSFKYLCDMTSELSLCGTTSVLHKNEYIIVGKHFKILKFSANIIVGRTTLEKVNIKVGKSKTL